MHLYFLKKLHINKVKIVTEFSRISQMSAKNKQIKGNNVIRSFVAKNL